MGQHTGKLFVDPVILEEPRARVYLAVGHQTEANKRVGRTDVIHEPIWRHDANKQCGFRQRDHGKRAQFQERHRVTTCSHVVCHVVIYSLQVSIFHKILATIMFYITSYYVILVPFV